ncbi:MAG: XRE family transcriptional regulator [Alphaproteobacteria bacterium]|nr:XRE family transcriptional regulator [Alphaproteobacteria bacterium]
MPPALPRLAETIKQLRRRHGLSLAGLAARSNVSKAMLSRIERGEANPSAVVLDRVAGALGVGISQLMGRPEQAEMVVLPAASQPVLADGATGLKRRAVSPVLPSRGVDVVHNTLPKGGSTGTFPAHPQGVQEHILVLQGRLRATLGERPTERHAELRAGDALYFEAHVPHRFDNIGPGEAAWVLVIDASRLRG